MSWRIWLIKKIFGFDPKKYENDMKILVDTMSSQVADLIIFKEQYNKDIIKMKENLPSEEWHDLVQDIIKSLDERTKDMADCILTHKEALEYIFSEDNSITMTEWGLVSNNKSSD